MTTPTPTTPSQAERLWRERNLLDRQCARLQGKVDDLRSERDRLLEAFRHTHQQAEDLSDTACQECSLDLRNPVHRRAELLTGEED